MTSGCNIWYHSFHIENESQLIKVFKASRDPYIESVKETSGFVTPHVQQKLEVESLFCGLICVLLPIVIKGCFHCLYISRNVCVARVISLVFFK